jgi:uncharacterized lipoprotein YajG
MKIKKFIRNINLLVTVFLVSGCVAGQTINMDYDDLQQTESKKYHGDIIIEVNDDRPYVLNGDKDPSYIGHYRAGFGNTWDVKTDSKEPLGIIISRDLQHKLQSLGFRIVSEGKNNKVLIISILDWNFDAYINGKYWIDCVVKVFDNSGKTIATHQVKNNGVIKGSVWVGAKYAFEKELPKIYSETIDKIIYEKPETLESLQN